MIRGKNVKMTVLDIAEGYTIVNPILLKPLDAETLIELYHMVQKVQTEIRTEKFPFHDPQILRKRNMKLQRLNLASGVIRAFAKLKRIILV